jgi:heme exporter protein B
MPSEIPSPSHAVSAPKPVPFWTQVAVLIGREVRLEWRMKYALGGVLLYLLAIVFLIFLSFEELEPRPWVLLFWIALLFTAANAVAKSFVLGGPGRWLYDYTLAGPQAIVLAKTVYNTALLVLLALLGLAIYAAMTGFPPRDLPLFAGTLILGASAFAAVFTLVSAIAARAANTGTLMAILGFPILVPVLRLLTALSLLSLELPSERFALLSGGQGLLLLAGINGFVVALALVLFPYLWRD